MQNTYMFKNYQHIDSDYIPNNTFLWQLPPDGVKDIIRGTTPEHFIHVPFNIKKDVDDIIITYKQAYTSVEKGLNDIKIKPDETIGDGDIIYFQFTEEETNKFRAIANEPCKVQIRVLLRNHDVIASDIYQIKILDVLNDKELTNELK